MLNFRNSVAVAAFALAAPAAFAGGYEPPVVEAQPVVVAPAAVVAGDWTGGYVGASLSYVITGKDRVGFHDAAPPHTYRGDIGSAKLNGLQGGLHLGYRNQVNDWVVGGELSYEASKAKDARSYDLTHTVGRGGKVTSAKDSTIGLRAKVGRLVDEQTLVYGTVGVARSKFKYTVHDDTYVNAANIEGVQKYNKTGFTVGLGVERKLNENWSVLGEYEYAHYKKTELLFRDVVTQATPKHHTIRLGVNYNF